MRVYSMVLGEDRLPYGACGKTLRRGLKRTRVDFGKLGIWMVPNGWLSTKKPDPIFGKAGKLALDILKDMGLV